MIKNIILWSFTLGLISCNNPNSQSRQTMQNKIPLEQIEEMFANMQAHGVNTDQKMLWGYFFNSPNIDNFTQVSDELKNKGFKLVDMYQGEDNLNWMHFERKEIHTPKSLFQLDEELYAIADKYQINYDGFDVGNEDEGQPLGQDTHVVPEE